MLPHYTALYVSSKMGLACKFATLLVVILVGLVYQQFHNLTKPLPKPTLDPAAFWGRSADASLTFSEELLAQDVYYEPEVTDELWRRLNASVWYHYALEGTNHEYGINSHTFEAFVEYWRSVYMPMWPERQALLNSVPHFKTRIQG